MQKKGFTLIEILIVLLVFSVGVLAVLRLILYNIDTMDSLNLKATATFLAKEGLELTYNTRDSNKKASLPRSCIKNKNFDDNIENEPCSNHFLNNNGIWKIEFNGQSPELTPITEASFEESKLFLRQDEFKNYYSHTPHQEEAIFARYLLFTGIIENENIVSSDHILKIESHVLYQKGNKKGKIILESFIWKY